MLSVLVTPGLYNLSTSFCHSVAIRCFIRQVYAILDTGDPSILGIAQPQDKFDRIKMIVEDNTHLSALRALLELGQTALDLGEIESAVGVFERRLRYQELHLQYTKL